MLARIRLATVLVCVLLCGPDAALATRPFAFAEHSDDDLRQLAASLARDTTGTEDADRVALARTLLVELRRFEASVTENRVVLIRREGNVSIPVGAEAPEVQWIRAWIVRDDGTVERFELDPARLVDGRGDFAAPELAPGDVVGWSAASRFPYGVAHHRLPLAIESPVLRTRVHVKSEVHLVHQVEVFHAEGLDVVVDVRERRDGQPSWHQIDASTIPRSRTAVFATHPVEREPYLRIARRGRYYPEFDSWILGNDWDTWAALELGPPDLWVDPELDLRRIALDVTTRAMSDRERADLAFAWLQDNVSLEREPFPSSAFAGAARAVSLDPIQLEDALAYNRGPSDFYGQRLPMEWERNEVTGDPHIGLRRGFTRARPMSEVIASGVADPVERTLLMAGLLESAGVQWLIGLARDARLGPLDFEATGHWQFNDLVVVLLAPDRSPDRWYCPTRTGTGPNTLGPGLHDVGVLFVDPGVDEVLPEIWDAAWREHSGVPRRVIPTYIEAVGRQAVVRMLRSPSGPELPPLHTTEVVRYGRDGRLTEARTEPPDARSIAAPPDTIELPVGDATTWTVPARAAFPGNPLEGWAGTDRPPFHAERTIEYRWSVELPLPGHWNGARGFDPLTLDHEALHYRARLIEGAGTLVVDRQLVLRRGTVDGEAMTELDEVVRAMLAFESSPLTLSATAGSR